MPDDVLRALGDQALAAGHRMIDHVALTHTFEAAGLSHDDWFGRLVELRTEKLVQMRDYDGTVALLQLTQPGLWAYAVRFRPDLADVTERLLDVLDTVEANTAVPLGADLGVPPLLVEAVLDHLGGRGLVVFSRLGADSFRIHRFSG
jgi:hypothetical protein